MLAMKRRLLINATSILVLLGIMVIVWSWFSSGSPIQTRLRDAIQSAHQVIVIVHSSRWDDPEVNEHSIKNYKEEVFQTVELGPGQRESLLQALPTAKDVSDRVTTMCIFVPHHRIEIVNADGSKLVWEICFHCGEHFVAGDRVRILPAGWPASLKSFFQSQKIKTDVPEKKDGQQSAAANLPIALRLQFTRPVDRAAEMLVLFQPAGSMEDFFKHMSKLGKEIPKNQEARLKQLWADHGMEIMGPPLKV
jgi:hypothetical protein